MRNKTIIIFFWLLFIAALLRSINLERGFFGDEAITLERASVKFSEITPALISHDAHPPLTSILLHLLIRVNQSEIFIRCYFILFGIGVLILIYLITLEYFNKNKAAALLALFLGTVSPMLISMSQFVRNYIDSAFWMLLSNYFFLLIIRNKANKRVWAGYVSAVLLSIYTFYFSFLLIISQCIYIFIFKFKERNLIKKWLSAQISIFLLYLPWIFSLVKQLRVNSATSSASLHWERVAFKFSGLELGTYVRNIASLFGLDYFFMVYPDGIKAHFGLFILLLMAVSALVILSYFLFYMLKIIKENLADNNGEAWVLLFLSFLPVLISWLIAKVTSAPPNARYLAAPHAMFLILISYFFYNLICRYKKTGLVLLCMFASLYIVRIPAATTPIYEGRKALEYLQGKVNVGDCIVMVDRLPGRERLPIPSFNIENDLYERDPLTSEYRILPEASTKKIEEILGSFRRIWFIRCYGNTEALGGNKIVYDFLRSIGRKEIGAEEFHNIKVILME